MNDAGHPIDARSRDAGMSLIEVIVALLVFALLSTGVVAGMVTIVRMTDDNRARVAATGLAAQDIALARAVGDPFTLVAEVPPATAITVGNRTYTVTRTVSLVSRTGTDASCDSNDILYARVNTRVTWRGKLSSTPDVQDDTIVAPQGRINDSSTGSVTVSVTGADGTPRRGISVTITPVSGGAALTNQPADTDANGCTKALKVTPGTYAVTLSEPGYLDVQQQPSPTKTVIVTAGANQALSFQYDDAAIYRTAYIPFPSAYTGTTLLPTNLDTTFLNSTSGVYTTTSPASSVALHPFPSGYTAVAGTPADSTGAATCAANDPRSWAGSTSGGPSRQSGVAAVGAIGAGQTTDFTTSYRTGGSIVSQTGIPMGVVELKYSTPLTATLITATTATPPVGTANPGCSTSRTYRFSGITLSSKVGLLLPYGSYTVSVSILGLPVSQVPASYMTVPTNVSSDGVASNGVVTLDPRPKS